MPIRSLSAIALVCVAAAIPFGRVLRAQAVDWKPFVTLRPEDGLKFTVSRTVLVEGGGVPVPEVLAGGQALLIGYAGSAGLGALSTTDGRTHTPAQTPNRGADGGFIYLADGRIRFVGEEPAPGTTEQRRLSHIASWISSDGMTWQREPGIRYQPGADDDSISSVPSVIQVHDSVWRMYYVGDFYRTNGARTAITNDWGMTWRAESGGNILRRGDVDPQPVYLTDGRMRLYMRTGLGSPDHARSGIAFCDSDDGLHFDSNRVQLVIPDSTAPDTWKLDPAVVRFPDGTVACYFGGARPPGDPRGPGSALMVAYADSKAGVTFGVESEPKELRLSAR